MTAGQRKALVKICGLRDTEILHAVLPLPIDYIGFMFAKSRRQITGAQAGELIRVLRAQAAAGTPVPQTVGVFMNPTKEELAAVLREAPLDVVQLHGSEPPELCRWVRETFGVQLIKVVSIGGETADRPLGEQLVPYAGSIDVLLLDTFDPVVGGGSGKTFAWDRIPDYQEWAREANVPLLVAGGLQVDNVGELLAAYAPDGVDVSSGVETDGVKDIAKIKAFVERVKQHASSAG